MRLHAGWPRRIVQSRSQHTRRTGYIPFSSTLRLGKAWSISFGQVHSRRSHSTVMFVLRKENCKGNWNSEEFFYGNDRRLFASLFSKETKETIANEVIGNWLNQHPTTYTLTVTFSSKVRKFALSSCWNVKIINFTKTDNMSIEYMAWSVIGQRSCQTKNYMLLAAFSTYELNDTLPKVRNI